MIRMPQRSTLFFAIVATSCFVFVVFREGGHSEWNNVRGWGTKNATTTSDNIISEGHIVSTSNKTVPETKTEKPLLVLHVGPRKTGAERIQLFASKNEKLLQRDNLYFLGHNPLHSDGSGQNLHQLYQTCATRKDEKNCKKLWDDFERVLQDHRSKNHMVMVSEELFNNYHDAEELLWTRLHRLRSQWHVRVVFTYRHYFEWVCAWYKNLYNPEKPGQEYGSLLEFQDIGRGSTPSLPDFVDRLQSQRFRHPQVLKKRWDDNFSEVKIFNSMRAEGDIMSEFFCSIFPEAKRLCNSFKKKSNATKSKRSFSSELISYDTLAVGAYRRGVVDDAFSRAEAVETIESKATKMNYTLTDIPRKCLSQNQLDKLLNMSLSMEQNMLPKDYSSWGKAELESSFAKAYGDGMFCSIDFDSLLRDKKWRQVLGSVGCLAQQGPIPKELSLTAKERKSLPPDYKDLDVDVSFLGIGAHAAGTTWLAKVLDTCRPLISLSTTKEIHFWDNFRDKGLGWYSEQFPNRASCVDSTTFQGEVTPSYASLPEDDIREIRALFPNVRLVFLARDLVDRAWSHIRKNLNKRLKRNKVETSSTEIYDDDFFMHMVQGDNYMERANYGANMKRWYKHFPEEQILIINFESIIENSTGVLDQVLRHIGVADQDAGTCLEKARKKAEQQINAGSHDILRPSLRRKFENLLRPKAQEFNQVLKDHGYNWTLNDYT